MLNLDLVKLTFIQKIQLCIEKFTCNNIPLPSGLYMCTHTAITISTVQS